MKNKKNDLVISPLTWVVNKKNISKAIIQTITKIINNYRETFLDFGSVLLHVLSEQQKNNIQIKKIYKPLI